MALLNQNKDNVRRVKKISMAKKWRTHKKVFQTLGNEK